MSIAKEIREIIEKSVDFKLIQETQKTECHYDHSISDLLSSLNFAPSFRIDLDTNYDLQYYYHKIEPATIISIASSNGAYSLEDLRKAEMQLYQELQDKIDAGKINNGITLKHACANYKGSIFPSSISFSEIIGTKKTIYRSEYCLNKSIPLSKYFENSDKQSNEDLLKKLRQRDIKLNFETERYVSFTFEAASITRYLRNIQIIFYPNTEIAEKCIAGNFLFVPHKFLKSYQQQSRGLLSIVCSAASGWLSSAREEKGALTFPAEGKASVLDEHQKKKSKV